MGRDPVGKLLLEFSLPATASMLVSALYSLADRVFIGRGAGIEGIAAATAAFPVMILGMAVGMLFASGSRAAAALALGRKDPAAAVEAVSRGTGAAFLATALLSLAGRIFARPLLTLFGAGPGILEPAAEFLGILLVGLPFQSATLTAASALLVSGRPGASFAANLAGTVLNLILDPLFIFAFRWGLPGAAAATSICQVLSLVLALIRGGEGGLRLDPARLAPRGRILGTVVSLGLPIFLVHIVSTAILITANNAVRPYGGDLALAVIGVVNTLGMVLGYPLYGITNGAQTLFGYNYGAGNIERLRRLSALVGIWTFLLAAAAALVSVAVPGVLIRLFNDDPALVALGSRALPVFMVLSFLFPLEQLPSSYFQSTGRPVRAGILMLSHNFAMILGMLVLPARFGFDGVCLAGPAADLVAALVGTALILRMGKELGFGGPSRGSVPLPVAPSRAALSAEGPAA
jgi:putative MATE family efflux protein